MNVKFIFMKKFILITLLIGMHLLLIRFIRQQRVQKDARKKENHLVDPRIDLLSDYLLQFQPAHFKIRQDFTLPIPRATLPIYDLIRQDWMRDLRSYLETVPPKTSSPVSIVSSDSSFKDVLYNWLISATVETSPPLSHILILSLDLPLHKTLTEHGFNSVYVDTKALLNTKTQSLVERSGKKAFHIVMVLRLTVMRLLNHWGYDTANYDTDAIILRNPEALYYNTLNTSHLIGSRGRFPSQIKDIFGVTLCAGIFMIKSGSETEEFWNTLSQLIPKTYDDQERINVALSKMDLKWEHNGTPIEANNWIGKSLKTPGFTVTILTEDYICRRSCTVKKKSLYYVWHHGGKKSEGKVKEAKLGRLWYLKENWNQQSSDAKGDEWLREMKM